VVWVGKRMASKVEVRVLERFGPFARLKAKKRKLWQEIGERILALPQKQQDILLEDFLTAIQSRLMVMERINDANRNGHG
jgi:hypothetical protein